MNAKEEWRRGRGQNGDAGPIYGKEVREEKLLFRAPERGTLFTGHH